MNISIKISFGTAIGLLLLLLWKILTTIHDRLEYAKFLRDRDLAKWPRVWKTFEFKKM